MFQRFILSLHKTEDTALVVLLLLLVSISLLQIVLRNFGLSGFIWFDTATRIIVLWMALLGAMRASRLQNHIAIDLVSHYASKKAQKIIHFFVSQACAFICGVGAYFSYLFVQSEYEYPSIAFLNIPTWATESIIPVSLAVIALRFILYSFNPIEEYEVVDD